jgi:hypothetical protein
MLRLRSVRLAALALVLAAAACSRAVQVGSGPAPTYPIEVRNTLSQDVIVAYDDGAGARTLGTVEAGGTERYIIASPRTMTVSITGRATSGQQTFGPFSVDLEAGSTPTVTIR